MQLCGLFLVALALQQQAAQAFAYSNRSPTQPLWRLQLQHSKPLKMSSGAVIVDEPGSTAAVAPTAKYSSVSSSSLNLLKNCVGAGVFSLNSRILSVSTNPMTIVPASFLVVAMALWASYNFFMVGETCRLTESSTYAEAWSKSVSSSSQWIVQTFLVIAPIVSCLASSIVLTDIFALVLRLVGLPTAVYGNRNLVITLLASIVLYPLCILKDLTALRSVSVFGIFGHMAAMAALGARVLDKSYFAGGRFYNAAAASAGAAIKATTGFKATASKWLVLASLLSYCFVAHYNAPKYFTELAEEDRQPKRFFQMALTAYMNGAAMYIGTAALGILLFGPGSASFALNSFSPVDPLGTVARLAFGASVLASFPLIFFAMRNFFVEKAKKYVPALGNVERMAAVLVAFVSFLTSKFTDIGVVGSISGGVLGSSMMFVFPPIMYIRALQKKAQKDGKPSPKLTILANILLMLSGAALGVTGTASSILASMKK